MKIFEVQTVFHWNVFEKGVIDDNSTLAQLLVCFCVIDYNVDEFNSTASIPIHNKTQ